MSYVLLYFAVGAITLALTRLEAYVVKKKFGPSLDESWTELKMQKAGTWQRLVHKVILPALTAIMVICFWPVAMVLLVRGLISHRRLARSLDARKFRLQEQDLIEQLSIEEIEARELVRDPLGGAPNEPFGHLAPQWKAFTKKLKADATLWSFAAMDDSTHEVTKLKGYVHIDKKGAQSMFLTVKNPLSPEEQWDLAKSKQQSA